MFVHHSKKDPELLPKTMPCLQRLLSDENVNVQKKVILSLSNVYKSLLMVISGLYHTVLVFFYVTNSITHSTKHQ